MMSFAFGAAEWKVKLDSLGPCLGRISDDESADLRQIPHSQKDGIGFGDSNLSIAQSSWHLNRNVPTSSSNL
jgi:hypothetical protein